MMLRAVHANSKVVQPGCQHKKVLGHTRSRQPIIKCADSSGTGGSGMKTAQLQEQVPGAAVQAGFSMSLSPDITGFVKYVCREAWIWRSVVGSSMSSVSISLAILTSTSLYSAKAAGASTPAVLITLMWVTAFGVLTHLCFELHNQISGVEEDRINKPHRPIPSGLMTMSGAVWRLVLYSVTMCVLAWHGAILPHAVTIHLLLVLNYHLGWGQNWLTKSLWVGLASAVSLASIGQMTANLLQHTASDINRVSIMLGIMIALTAAVQDFKDVAGDKAVGRRTLPVAFGDMTARVVCSGLLLMSSMVWPACVSSLLSPVANTSTAALVLYGLQGLLACWLAYHTLACSRQGNDRHIFAGYAVLLACWMITPTCLLAL